MVAARGLRKYPSDRVLEALVASINDTDEDVQIASVRSLGDIKDCRAIEPLLELARQTGGGQLYRWTLSSLAALRVPDVIPLLLQELSTGDMPKRRWMAYVLGELGEPSTIEPLRRAAEVDSFLQRRWYKRAIRKIQRRGTR